jgi:xylitol oxidase
MTDTEMNWAGNYTYSTVRLHRPVTLAQVQEIVSQRNKLRVLGSRHSFNGIADSHEDLISLEHLNHVTALDREHHTVTIEGGIRYGDLCKYLQNEGFALHNLASLPHISVAGACATATHGSGNNNGNLAAAVTALEIVTANGGLINLTREHDGEKFLGAVVGLGGLGVVTKLTLNIEPAYEMVQAVYENLALAEVENHFDEITGSAYSVSLFTDWQDESFNQVWLKQRLTDSTAETGTSDFFGATPASFDLHPIRAISAENCTAQMRIPGSWYERLPHFRMDFTPSSGEELQTEYLIPRQYAIAAIQTINRLRSKISPLLLISEIRTIAADTLWLSPCYGQACVALHFTWKKDWDAVKQLLPFIEEQLAPFQARPHWGKLFTMPPAQVRALYERLPDFQDLLNTYDPQGKFHNDFLDAYIFGTD